MSVVHLKKKKKKRFAIDFYTIGDEDERNVSLSGREEEDGGLHRISGK